MRTTAIALTAAATLAACAQAPGEIAPSYVSAAAYDGMSCARLDAEAQRVSDRLTDASGRQQAAADTDAAMTAVALVLFWPAVFAVGAGDAAPEVARLKGEAQAIHDAATRRGC